MVATGFYLLSLLMFFSVFYILGRSVQSQKLVRRYVAGFVAWMVYLLVLSNLGLLDSFDQPPIIPLLVVIPAIILILIITSQKLLKDALAKVPLSFPIYIQGFRIGVELLIYGGFLNGIFPEAVTFEGTNFDILVGISALIAGYLAQRKMIGKTGIMIWNIASLAILSLTVFTFISTYYFSDFQNTSSALYFVKMPYLLLASVLLPFAVFYHVVSIRQHLKR